MTVAPILTVNTTSVAPGGQVTVTLTGGFGGGADWLAFAADERTRTQLRKLRLHRRRRVTRTWTVTAPTTPGTFEFRLFLNNLLYTGCDESAGCRGGAVM